MNVFVVSPFFRFSPCSFPHESTVSELIEHFSALKGVSCLDFYVSKNGRLSGGEERLQAGAVYRLEPRLYGGKGGFGSMLRALGAQIEKTTNREACRDLSGRRLRDVNHEKEMAEWLKKQTDRDAEKEQRRMEKIRRKLAEPKRGFLDAEFDQQCHDLSERLEDSVLKGMQASSSSLVQAEDKPCRKRPAAKANVVSASHSKKNCFWTGLEGIQDSTDEDSDESEAEGFFPHQSSSSSSSSCSISTVASPSSVLRQATVLISTTREQEKESQHLQSLPCSSSSSDACLASCFPPLIQENREEKEENKEGAQEEKLIETEQEKEVDHFKPPQEKEEHREMKHEEKAEESSDMKHEEKRKTLSVSITHKAEKEKNVELANPQTVQPEDVDTVLDLLSVSKAEELEAMGLERLKVELMKRGMKCGGTLQERATRLFSVRGLGADQIESALLAKPSKGKKK